MAFLEEEDNLQTTVNAIDYSKRYPTVYWKKLWILTDTDNTPIQEIEDIKTNWLDISTTLYNYIARLKDSEEIIEWTWSVLAWISPIASCKRLFEIGWKRDNWVYKINPAWTWELEVYCDMTTDWWGWTIVYNQEWSDDEKIVWNIDITIGIPWLLTEHRVEASKLYLVWSSEILIMQDLNWIILGETTNDIFNKVFNENWSHWDDLKIINSSSNIWITLMDQDSHTTSLWVYQWNISEQWSWNSFTCFEYSKIWTDNNHEWIVFPNCDWILSSSSWIWFTRRWIVWLR